MATAPTRSDIPEYRVVVEATGEVLALSDSRDMATKIARNWTLRSALGPCVVQPNRDLDAQRRAANARVQEVTRA